MNAEEKYALFEDYLNDDLTDLQRTDLEFRLKEDRALREELALYRETRDAISARIRWEESERPFIQSLERLSKEHFKSDKGAWFIKLPRRRLLMKVMSAAAILLFVVFVWHPWQKDIYTRYAQHPSADLVERNISTTLSEGGRAFNDGEYQAALDAFTLYLVDHPGDFEVLFYQGICYLELDKANTAKNNFRQLFSANGPYRDASAWYLGLTFLKQNNLDSMAWYLRQVDETSEYYRKAQILSKKL